MQGEIDTFDPRAGVGEIAGIDGVRYRFAVAEMGAAPAAMGVWVNFVASADGVARNITLAQSPASEGGFDAGRVVRLTFAAIGRHWALYLGGAILFTGVPGAFSAWGEQDMAAYGLTATNLLATALGTLGYVGGIYVFAGVVSKTTLNGFRGETTRLSETLRIGARKALPLFALGVLATLGILAGMVLVLIPGIILSIWWVVVAPCLVIEGRGIFDSFGRSRALTEGRRSAIFGLCVVYGLLSLMLGFALVRLGASIAANVQGADRIIAGIATDAIGNVVSNVVSAAGVTVLYYELRKSKDGAGADDLATVFD
jgi:hypothetical protein